MKNNIHNAMSIRLEDIASSLGMPEMPNVDVLEEETAMLKIQNPRLSEEGLRTIGLWHRGKAFADSEQSIDNTLRQRIKNYDLDVYLENRVFTFYPRTNWSSVGAKMNRIRKFRERPSWREEVESILKSGLSQLQDPVANSDQEVLHSKEGEGQRSLNDSGIT